jgi:hypothetical protein
LAFSSLLAVTAEIISADEMETGPGLAIEARGVDEFICERI